MEKPKICFVIMPFGKRGTPEFEHHLWIYREMIKPVLKELGYKAVRADELEHFGNITRDIINLLYEGDLVIADLSGKNANVFYELGVRHALFHCGTIPIIKDGETLPFDIANYRTIFYSTDKNGPEIFRKELIWRIEAFEDKKKHISDNPVHDIIGDKILQMDTIKQENVAIKKQVAENQDLLQTLRSAKQALENKLDAANSHQQKIRQELETIQEQYQALQQENEKLQAKLAQQKKAEKTADQWAKEKTKYEQQIAALEKKLRELAQPPEAPSPKATPKTAAPPSKPRFRSQPTYLSEDEVKKMLKENDFFDSDYNKKGRGFENQFEVMTLKGEKVIFDQASGLMWQQGGSDDSIVFKDTEAYIKKLNDQKFAGFNGWRLPTLEEAMSLMASKKNKADLYIDERFDSTQEYIWTSDQETSGSRRWVVRFYDGSCYWLHIANGSFVRGVRLGQAS